MLSDFCFNKVFLGNRGWDAGPCQSITGRKAMSYHLPPGPNTTNSATSLVTCYLFRSFKKTRRIYDLIVCYQPIDSSYDPISPAPLPCLRTFPPAVPSSKICDMTYRGNCGAYLIDLLDQLTTRVYYFPYHPLSLVVYHTPHLMLSLSNQRVEDPI